MVLYPGAGIGGHLQRLPSYCSMEWKRYSRVMIEMLAAGGQELSYHKKLLNIIRGWGLQYQPVSHKSM